MNVTALLLSLALLSGCAAHPITGREQILALSALQVAHAEARYAIATGAQWIAASPSCGVECGSAEDLARFPGRIRAIAAHLEAAARDMSPDLFERIGKFQIEVSDSLGAGTGSSAGGRIALGSGIAALEPSDTVIAFLLAREMAHVIARHAEEDSGASLVFSVLGMLLPGVNVIARFVASTLGAGALKSSWAAQQQREADEIALVLLERSGLPARHVALELEAGIRRVRLPGDGWGAGYAESAQRIALIVASPPRSAAPGECPAGQGLACDR